ncbi:MAG: protein kinase [Chloroflexaceae bacterium]|nr:protein kinase [Chloroflexaceae bacterium]
MWAVMSDPTTSSTPPLLFNRYRLLEKLGDGRLASVYHATDERLQRSVLLHVLRKDLSENENMRQRFVNEISANAQLSHSALLEVFDSGEVQDRPFMVTEYINGRPLYQQGPIAPEHVAGYIRQVASAVAVCQLRGLQHPPISSRNVFLVSDDRIEFSKAGSPHPPRYRLIWRTTVPRN